MRTLTETEIASYRRDGFVVAPNFLSADELARLRSSLEHAVAERNGRVLPRPLDEYPIGDALSKAGRSLVQCINLWQSSPAMREFVLSPQLGRVACDLEGIDGVRIWQDQIATKPPGGEPTVWHCDTPILSATTDHAVSMWIAMDDATVENGCLRYRRGGHRWRGAEAEGDEVSCPVSMGGLIAHNGWTPHASHPNTTDDQRPAMTLTYIPDGSAFDGTEHILTYGQLSRLKVGDRLADDEYCPLVFAR